MNFKILNTIGDKFTSRARGPLEEIGIVDYQIPSQVELREIISQYEICVIGLGLNFYKEEIDRASKLKVIATATTGLDHIDVAYAESKGITILSLRGENDFLDTITGTAELTLGLMIDLLRYSPWAFDSVKNYQWDREQFRGFNLYGKTLGIVGLGRLGKMMARYGKALGMKVLFADPLVENIEYQKVSFDQLLKESDVISVHVHLTGETENMFSAKVFAQMKTTVYLINTSRGKIVEEGDLLQALKDKQIAGYGTDVLSDELSFEKAGFNNHPLVEFSKHNRNVIIVPHIGGMTYDSREATDVFIAEKTNTFFKRQ